MDTNLRITDPAQYPIRRMATLISCEVVINDDGTVTLDMAGYSLTQALTEMRNG